MKSWKVLSIAGLAAAGIAVWSGIGQAQHNGAFVNQREAAQAQRIQDGLQSGALTPHEAGRLDSEQQRILGAEAQMRSDGRLDPNEKAILDRMQNRADYNISRERRDNRVAYDRPGNHYGERNRWRHNQRRGHHSGMENQRGPHYGPREHGAYRREGCRQGYGDRGRAHRGPNRDRRFTWNH